MPLLARQLMVDPRVQRDRENDSKPETMAKDGMDWHKMETPTVVPTDETTDDGLPVYLVTEGQARTLMAQMVDPDLTITTMVLPTIPPEAQSALGLAISTSRTPMSPFDKWRLAVASPDEHPHEAAAAEVLAERGLRVVRSSHSASHLRCAQTLAQIVRSGRRSPEEGAVLLARVVDLIERAWPTGVPTTDSSRWEAPILRAVAGIYADPANREVGIDDARLADRLASTTASRWITLGKQGDGSNAVVIRNLLTTAYNKNLRKGRLQ
jgi:hypothetical protein